MLNSFTAGCNCQQATSACLKPVPLTYTTCVAVCVDGDDLCAIIAGFVGTLRNSRRKQGQACLCELVVYNIYMSPFIGAANSSACLQLKFKNLSSLFPRHVQLYSCRLTVSACSVAQATQVQAHSSIQACLSVFNTESWRLSIRKA